MAGKPGRALASLPASEPDLQRRKAARGHNAHDTDLPEERHVVAWFEVERSDPAATTKPCGPAQRRAVIAAVRIQRDLPGRRSRSVVTPTTAAKRPPRE